MGTDDKYNEKNESNKKWLKIENNKHIKIHKGLFTPPPEIRVKI